MMKVNLFILVTFLANMSFAQSKEETTSKSKKGSKSVVQLSGQLSTTLYYRNDTDFDASPRFDDLDGQTDSQFATNFNPTLDIQANKQVKVRYQLELGWNAWGLNNPSQPNQFMAMPGAPLQGRHKEVWAQINKKRSFFRFGFQNIKDPSGLFLNHSVGALLGRLSSGKHRLQLVFAQMADTTYEGIGFNRDYITDDNLTTDRLLFGADYRWKKKNYKLALAAYGMSDESLFDRELRLGTFVLAVENKSLKKSKNQYKFWVHLLAQGGWQNMASALNEQVDYRAYAFQTGVRFKQGDKLTWGLRSFGLSPDDDEDGNDLQGSFLGSAKNHSKTRLLTEDEQRDRYDNIDERVGQYVGMFAFNPAGLMVTDAALAYQFSPAYRIEAVAGLAAALNTKRALGQRWIGTEFTINQRYQLSQGAYIHANVLCLLPGKAGAVLLNDLDREATETLYGVSLGATASF